jgi:hypothetical protein
MVECGSVILGNDGKRRVGEERGCLPGSFFAERFIPLSYVLLVRSGTLSSRTETEGPVRHGISNGSPAWNDGVLRIVLRAILEFVS